MSDRKSFEQFGRETIEVEAHALSALAKQVDAGFTRACELALATQGRVVLRRLNRVEYENTIRDLLAIDVHLQDLLPADGSDHGFERYYALRAAAGDAARPARPSGRSYGELDDPGFGSRAKRAPGRQTPNSLRNSCWTFLFSFLSTSGSMDSIFSSSSAGSPFGYFTPGWPT